MSKLTFALDTNIVVDFLNVREPYYESARKLMICGRVGEFELCITSSQITDLIYILSDGGQRNKIPSTLEALRSLRTFISVLPISSDEIDSMLNSAWNDPEDFLIYDTAMRHRADAVISRNKKDFKSSAIPVLDCDELFDWLKNKLGVVYDAIDFE